MPTNKMTYIGIVIALFGVVMLIALALASVSSEKSSTVKERTAPIKDAVAPNFETMTLAGDTVNLHDYRGQVVLVNFWATWCPPCKAEMPDIDAYYAANKEKGLVVLAVNAQEPAATVRSFIEQRSFTFPVLLDEKGEIVQQYRIRSFPTSLIIDREGVIHYIQTGMISPAQLEAIVGPLL